MSKTLGIEIPQYLHESTIVHGQDTFVFFPIRFLFRNSGSYWPVFDEVRQLLGQGRPGCRLGNKPWTSSFDLSFKGMHGLLFLFFSPKKRERKDCLMQFPRRICPLCVHLKFTTYSNCKITNISPWVFFWWNFMMKQRSVQLQQTIFLGYKMAQNGHILKGKKKWNHQI